jgi:hypothetical protein
MSLLLRRAAIADAYQAPVGGGFTDNFNRADAASLGAPWSYSGANWAIVSNKARPPAGLTDYDAAVVNASLVDCTVQVTINAPVGLNFDGGLVARYVDINNFIFMDISLAGSSFLTRTFQRVGGSFSGLTSLVNPVSGIAPGTPFTAKMVLSGSTGESFINNVSMGTFSGVNAALLSSTTHGMVCSLDDVVTPPDFEDFSAT